LIGVGGKDQYLLVKQTATPFWLSRDTALTPESNDTKYFAGLRIGMIPCSLSGNGEGNEDLKGRAFMMAAGDPDVTLHQLAELVGDGEP
jgi:hypothetical protein